MFLLLLTLIQNVPHIVYIYYITVLLLFKYSATCIRHWTVLYTLDVTAIERDALHFVWKVVFVLAFRMTKGSAIETFQAYFVFVPVIVIGFLFVVYGNAVVANVDDMVCVRFQSCDVVAC